MASRGKDTAGTNGEGREGGARRCAGGSPSRSRRGLESLSRGGRGPRAPTAQVGSPRKPAGLCRGPQSRARGPSPSRPAPRGRGRLRVPDCLLEGARGSHVPLARPSRPCGHLSACPCSGPQARARTAGQVCGGGCRWGAPGVRGKQPRASGPRPRAWDTAPSLHPTFRGWMGGPSAQTPAGSCGRGRLPHQGSGERRSLSQDPAPAALLASSPASACLGQVFSAPVRSLTTLSAPCGTRLVAQRPAHSRRATPSE